MKKALLLSLLLMSLGQAQVLPIMQKVADYQIAIWDSTNGYPYDAPFVLDTVFVKLDADSLQFSIIYSSSTEILGTQTLTGTSEAVYTSFTNANVPRSYLKFIIGYVGDTLGRITVFLKGHKL